MTIHISTQKVHSTEEQHLNVHGAERKKERKRERQGAERERGLGGRERGTWFGVGCESVVGEKREGEDKSWTRIGRLHAAFCTAAFQ